MKRFLSGMTVMIVCFALSTNARPVHRWTLPNIYELSEFVVLAQVQQVETGVIRKRLVATNEEAQEMLARLRIVKIFKGKATMSESKLEWYQPVVGVPSGATGFQPAIGHYYIMFLKSELGLQRLQAVGEETDTGDSLYQVGSEEPKVEDSGSPMDVVRRLLLGNQLAVFRLELQDRNAEGKASETAILDRKYVSEGGYHTLFEIVCQLRQQIVVNFEGAITPIDKKIELEKGEIPLGQLLEKIKKTIGYDYSVTGDVITFTDPAVRRLGENYVLDKIIEDYEIENITMQEAIDLIGKKQPLQMFAITMAKYPLDKHISLHLRHVAVREILNQIVKAGGHRGWNSSTMQVEEKTGLRVVEIITM